MTATDRSGVKVDEGAPDEALVARALGGGPDAGAAMAALVARHDGRLLACCRELLGPVEAEDAAQEALALALASLARLRVPARFGAWLVGIGRNVCRRRLRELAGAPWSWEAAQGGRARDWATSAPGPGELAEAGEVARELLAEVAALPAGQRDAVRLHYLAGLSQAETAARAGTSVGAVKVRLHEARRRLRARLAPSGREEPMETTTTAIEWVRMRVGDVRRGPAAERAGERGDAASREAAGGAGELPERFVILLQELDGERRLPIWVGAFEGTALALAVAGVELPRPGTHRLAAGLLAAAGGALAEVRITRLDDGTFYAEALVSAPGGAAVVDARPSDAIAMAVEAGAPILVDPAVLAAAAASPPRIGGLDQLPDGAAEIAAARQAEWARTMALLALEREPGQGGQPRSGPPGPRTPD